MSEDLAVFWVAHHCRVVAWNRYRMNGPRIDDQVPAKLWQVCIAARLLVRRYPTTKRLTGIKLVYFDWERRNAIRL